MKHAKGWEEEEDDYALFASPPSKKGPKKAFKGRCGYCGEFGHKAADCPNNKSNQNKGLLKKLNFQLYSTSLVPSSSLKQLVYMYLSQLMSTFTNYLKVHHSLDGYFIL